MMKKILLMGLISLNFCAIKSQAAAGAPEHDDWLRRQEVSLRIKEEQEDAAAIRWAKESKRIAPLKLIANKIDPDPKRFDRTKGLGYVPPQVLGVSILRPSSLARAMIMKDSDCDYDFGKYSIQLQTTGVADVTVNGVMTRYNFNPRTYKMAHTPMNIGEFLNMMGIRYQE